MVQVHEIINYCYLLIFIKRIGSEMKIDAELWRIVQADQWVLEGGFNLLLDAIQHADGVI